LHYCILTEDDLSRDDQWIRRQIHDERLRWWRRSLSPFAGMASPAHGFVLWVVSRKVARAEPNEALRRFATLLRKCWGCPVATDNEGNDVATERLFLQNPSTGRVLQFTFNIDYFGAQGDGRWWHDHRFPGGIAFTANAMGHMARYHEYYENKQNQNAWSLETAMLTIDSAAETRFGRATNLLNLTDEHPAVRFACPVPGIDRRPALKGRDWTRYVGDLHTDHSIRREFFEPGPARRPSLADSHWLQDFTYLYDANSDDYKNMIAGQAISEQEATEALGPREEWRTIVLPRRDRAVAAVLRAGSSPSRRPVRAETRIQAALQECDRWKLSARALDKLLG
jgi:hypothetical protein